MGVRVLTGHADGDDRREVSVLYCSTTGLAFGHLIDGDADVAESFLRYLRARGFDDARSLEPSQLANAYTLWLAEEEKADAETELVTADTEPAQPAADNVDAVGAIFGLRGLP